MNFLFLILFTSCYGNITDKSDNEKNKSKFINTVFNIATHISHNLTIHDNKVVFSPYLVVNAISQMEEEFENKFPGIRNGFETAGAFLETTKNLKMLSLGYTTNERILHRNYTNLKMSPLTTRNITELFQQAFYNNSHDNNNNNNSNSTQQLKATETVLLTSLGINANFNSQFHPKYTKISKFYVNKTHGVKEYFMNSVGFYKYFNFHGSEMLGMKLDGDLWMLFLRPINGEMEFFDFLKNVSRENYDFLKNISMENENDFKNVSMENENENNNLLNVSMENENNDFFGLFKKLKTKRMQISLPKFSVDSQFTMPTKNTHLHISSMRLTHTGITHNFFPSQQKGFKKFQRLKRRHDDILFRLNSPFRFYVYEEFAGILFSGIVNDPREISQDSENVQIASLSNSEKIQIQVSNDKCFGGFNYLRKNSSIYDDLFYRCHGEEFDFDFDFQEMMWKRFYRNEIEFVNTTFYEVAMGVKYGVFGAFDGRVVVVENENSTLTILYPNEKSGLHLIEETMETLRLEDLKCNFRNLNVRLRMMNVAMGNFSVNFKRLENNGEKKFEKFEKKLSLTKAFMVVVSDGNGLVGGIGRVAGGSLF